MTEQRKIQITIDPLGNPKVEAQNFNGVGCEAATAGIEAALAGGGGGVTRELKPEWHNTETEQEQMHW